MAVPTPVANERVEGSAYFLAWTAAWAATDNAANLVIVDRSGLAGSPAEIEIQKLIIQCTVGIDALVEFVHATDALVFQTLLGVTDQWVGEPPLGGMGIRAPASLARPFGAAGDGDVVLTTTSAASGDIVSLWLWAKLLF